MTIGTAIRFFYVLSDLRNGRQPVSRKRQTRRRAARLACHRQTSHHQLKMQRPHPTFSILQTTTNPSKPSPNCRQPTTTRFSIRSTRPALNRPLNGTLANSRSVRNSLTKPLFCTRLVFAADDDVSAVCTHLLCVVVVCRNRENLARAVSLCDVFLRDSKGSEQNEPANRKWMPVRIVCRPGLQ